jgi:hypothetical protein
MANSWGDDCFVSTGNGECDIIETRPRPIGRPYEPLARILTFGNVSHSSPYPDHPIRRQQVRHNRIDLRRLQ